MVVTPLLPILYPAPAVLPVSELVLYVNWFGTGGKVGDARLVTRIVKTVVTVLVVMLLAAVQITSSVMV
jgi:hypothetical protein